MYQAGNACFDTVGLAAAATAAAQVGQVLPAGSALYVVDAIGAADGSVTYSLTDTLSLASPVVFVATPTFPQCALLTAADGVAIGWGIAAAWIVAFTIVSIRKAL